MEDNVIHAAFPRNSRHEGQLERQVARLREIEHAGLKQGFGKKGPVFGTSDRILAAKVVGRLIRSAREQGVTVGQLREALERSGTSRVDRYQLPPEIDQTVAQASSTKLQGKVRGYLAVADAIAKLTGQDPDALKIDVLMPTALWSRPSSSQNDFDPRASHLALELAEMGRAVARRENLKELFSRASLVRGIWDTTSETLKPGSQSSLHAQGYLDWFEHWTEAPPLPSVPLVHCVHAILPFHRLRIELEGREHPLELAALIDDGFQAEEIYGWLELSREIRLALGPTTTSSEVGTMFESRAHVRLGLNPDSPCFLSILPSCTLKPQDDIRGDAPAAVFQVQRDGRWHRVMTVDSIDESEARIFASDADVLLWPTNPLDPRSLNIEHWYFSWSAVNEATLAHWFHRPSGTNNAAVRHLGNRPGDPVWYAPGTIGYEIEEDLERGGLERALTQAVRRVREAVSKRDSEWRIQAQSIHERRMARWGNRETEDTQDEADGL